MPLVHTAPHGGPLAVPAGPGVFVEGGFIQPGLASGSWEGGPASWRRAWGKRIWQMCGGDAEVLGQEAGPQRCIARPPTAPGSPPRAGLSLALAVLLTARPCGAAVLSASSRGCGSRTWPVCPQSVAESGVARRLGPGDLSPRLSFSWRDPLLVGGGRTAPPTPRSPPGVGANLEIPGAHSSLPWRPSRIRTGEDVNARPGHMGFVLQGGPQRDRREHRVPAFVVPFLPTAVISLDGTRRRPVGLRASFCISPRCGPLAPWPHLWWVGGGGNSPSGKIRYQRWAVP